MGPMQMDSTNMNGFSIVSSQKGISESGLPSKGGAPKRARTGYRASPKSTAHPCQHPTTASRGYLRKSAIASEAQEGSLGGISSSCMRQMNSLAARFAARL